MKFPKLALGASATVAAAGGIAAGTHSGRAASGSESKEEVKEPIVEDTSYLGKIKSKPWNGDSIWDEEKKELKKSIKPHSCIETMFPNAIQGREEILDDAADGTAAKIPEFGLDATKLHGCMEFKLASKEIKDDKAFFLADLEVGLRDGNRGYIFRKRWTNLEKKFRIITEVTPLEKTGESWGRSKNGEDSLLYLMEDQSNGGSFEVKFPEYYKKLENVKVTESDNLSNDDASSSSGIVWIWNRTDGGEKGGLFKEVTVKIGGTNLYDSSLVDDLKESGVKVYRYLGSSRNWKKLGTSPTDIASGIFGSSFTGKWVKSNNR